MKVKYAILGGGIAGLCAAIRLAELGEEPLLLEGGSYPAHKVCGEFLSPECLPFLDNWNLHPVPINQIVLRSKKSTTSFPFPSRAGGISHLLLDPSLADYAAKCGANIKTKTHVKSLHPKKNTGETHRIDFSSGESIEASHLLIATGRLSQNSSQTPSMSYMGFKAHFDHLPLEANTIEMFSLPGAYLGVSPVEDHKYNVACLADMKQLKGCDPLQFLKNAISQHPQLHALISKGNQLFEWMAAPTPSFGIKTTPAWPDVYFIGDAAVTIPPACGNGLSLAILGGRLAAEYAVRQQADEFKTMWAKRCSSQVFWAKILHRLMLNPSASAPMVKIAEYFPFVAKKIFDLTRQSSEDCNIPIFLCRQDREF